MIRLIESRGARDIAKRALETTGQIFRYAIAHGFAKRNPATEIRPRDALRSAPKTNFARIDARELPELLRKIEVYPGTHLTRFAMKLMALAFVRTRELIEATWSEFDLDAARWDIPAERMKMRTPHIVPLARQSLEVIRILRDVQNHAVFSRNRDRLLTSEVAQRFFAAVIAQAKRFISDEHFTVDGTLIQARGPHGQVFVRGVEAWASHKSFRKKDGSDGDGTNFHGQKRSNKTHASSTDPESRLYKKSYGTESKLAYLGHVLVENRNGLIAAAMATQADGFAERDAALLRLADKQKGSAARWMGRRQIMERNALFLQEGCCRFSRPCC